MRKLLQWIMDRRPTKVYQVEGEDLFYRSFLFNLLGWTFYLHHYLRSDPDRGLHDHPFKAVAIILSGGYWEYRLVGFGENGLKTWTRRLNPGAISYISPYIFHRVNINGKSNWSLFVCKYIKGKSWGFLRHTDEQVGHKTEGIANFYFRKAGEAELDHNWWHTAQKGKQTCRIR